MKQDACQGQIGPIKHLHQPLFAHLTKRSQSRPSGTAGSASVMCEWFLLFRNGPCLPSSKKYPASMRSNQLVPAWVSWEEGVGFNPLGVAAHARYKDQASLKSPYNRDAHLRELPWIPSYCKRMSGTTVHFVFPV